MVHSRSAQPVRANLSAPPIVTTEHRAAIRGQGLAEYALILALIAVFVIGALTFMGNGIATTLSAVGNAL